MQRFFRVLQVHHLYLVEQYFYNMNAESRHKLIVNNFSIKQSNRELQYVLEVHNKLFLLVFELFLAKIYFLLLKLIFDFIDHFVHQARNQFLK
jgi:hypothetical protein